MCFDPVTIGVAAGVALLTTAAEGVSGYFRNRATNKALVFQYKQQQEVQERTNRAAIEQYNEKLYRQRLQGRRDAQAAFEDAQAKVLETRKRGAIAASSAGESNITGLALDSLMDDYERSVGGISTNLSTTYQQLNENLFFDADSARRSGQSIINQAIPARPFLQPFDWVTPVAKGAMAGGMVLGNAALAGGFTNPFGGLGGGSGTGIAISHSPDAPVTAAGSVVA